jgi:hypothetical protein
LITEVDGVKQADAEWGEVIALPLFGQNAQMWVLILLICN